MYDDFKLNNYLKHSFIFYFKTRGAQGGGGLPKTPPRIEKSGKTPPLESKSRTPPPKPPSEARRLIFRVF